ncbi:MAG: GTP 3',8-cyclase MoaA [Deltaproteobacteria bacterium]|nr:GTP 3',8-cyclase MoaA [Deltaproteobacteria bacterium]
MQKIELHDSYNRRLNYLRISITDRCNLNCLYCLPELKVPKLSHDDILSYEEILRLVNIFVDLGMSKVRVTGGEPLVRKDVFTFLERLSRIDGLDDLSLTTNGLLLKDNLDKIKSAGIKRLNISLDTLKPEIYLKITGRDSFHQVMDAIHQSVLKGFSPIKLNVVALRGINDTELSDLAALSLKNPFHVRFIEVMPFKKHKTNEAPPLLAPEIKKGLQKVGNLVPVANSIHDGPARRFKFEGALGEIGFISPVTDHFCKHCNRLRLTADGRLRLCLLSDIQIDLKTPLRSSCSDSDLAALITQAIKNKPFESGLTTGKNIQISGHMSAIGG